MNNYIEKNQKKRLYSNIDYYQQHSHPDQYLTNQYYDNEENEDSSLSYQFNATFNNNYNNQNSPYTVESSSSNNLSNQSLEDNFNTFNSEQQEEMTGFSFPGLDYQSSKFSLTKMTKDTDSSENNGDDSDECSIVAKVKPRESHKKTLFSTKLLQEMLPEKLLRVNRKFYLFIDQMIDLDYFQDLKRPDNFANNNQAVQLTKGFRLTNQIIHRVDNKFIEIESELLDCHPQSIDYIIEILKSFGNADLLKYIMCLTEFQNNIFTCKNMIQMQALNQQFIDHHLERTQFANAKFREITASLDPTKLIFYQRYSVNYETNNYESNIAGYSPALYEVLDNGSYSFKDYLMKYGFFDPMSQLFRLGDCFYRTCYFMGNLPKEFGEEMNKLATLDLITVDNFRFPVYMKLDHHYLETEYDQQNNLKLNFCDLLAIYEFTFKDANALKNLQDVRKDEIKNQAKLETIQGEDIDWDQFDYVQTEFFNQYYQDQVKNLVKKGNKWYKRCGFVEIPTKKQKK